MKVLSLMVGPIMTNCYILCDEDARVCAVIDPGDEPKRIEAMIASSGCTPVMILLTHGHFDHCTGVAGLLETWPKLPVYIHKGDVTDSSGGDLLFHRLGEKNQRYYQEGDKLTVGGLTLDVLEEPIPMYPHNQKCLKELKYSLTRQIWNRYTSTIKEPQMQGILQGFRVVGSGSKLGREYPVTAYRLGGRVTLEKLLEFIPDSNGEQQQLLGLMRKGRLSLAEAKEKYPDWYERRIVKKERRGRWTVKRDLYDWWLHRIEDEIKVGHRFYGIMTLAIYAKKCGIDEKELRRDAFSLLKPYDDMSVEDINRFTKDDVVCALEMFNEDYVTFPRDDVAKISGLSMPVNKRNWRKQWEHLQFARGVREVKGKLGETVSGGGRPAAQDLVYEWRRQHPEGRKADCHRDTGLDPKTIRKWWDCPPPAVRVQNGHITVRVSPSQAVSDLPVEALGQSED